jgi:hypothetical protein
LELAEEELGEEFTRYFNPWWRGTMVLTDKKKLLSRYFSRLSRESLYTANLMFSTRFLLMTAAAVWTGKTALSA